MKTLLIFTFFLISGLAGCFDVTGYPGGYIRINCKHQQYGQNTKYFGNKGTKEWITVQNQMSWLHKEDISLLDYPGRLIVLHRNLSSQDSGSYRCGETGVWSHDVELKVKRDPCCSGPSAVTGFLGETLTINCPYPEEFKAKTKRFYKQDGADFTELITTTWSQRNRFSISEDRNSKVFSVRISDVREEDGGVYYCGVWVAGESISYDLFYTEIQLQVTERPPTTMNPTTASTVEEHLTPVSSTIIIIIIIIITVCLTLLLTGGPTLIFYKLRWKKTQDSASIRRPSGTKDRTDVDYANDQSGNNIRMDPMYCNNTNDTEAIYEIIDPNHVQYVSTYQSLDPNTIQSDTIYRSLDPNTNQSGPDYQSLDPRNRELPPIYQSLKPNPNQ
ncbi:CMRF35-like molecule 1 [Hoplias malabaricus]|uniref:CMRF35-like molecule 1 n=1 Tax=Hoplias malabaricus TaxID=27720 RepID=UPI003462127D